MTMPHAGRSPVAGLVLAAMLLLLPRLGAAYEGGPVGHGGTITGTVRVVGDVTPLPPQAVHKHVVECGATVPDERLMVDRAGMLQYAVASLAGITKGREMPAGPVVLRNHTCAFVPHVLSASVGQTLEIVNEDPFLHDAHAWLGQRTLFNLAIPRGRTVHHRLDEPGLIHINCNVRHTWMHAYLFVGENPYHAVSGPNGRFTLAEVPAGTYRLTVWHEMLGTIEKEVTVAAGGTATVDAEFQAVAPGAEP